MVLTNHSSSEVQDEVQDSRTDLWPEEGIPLVFIRQWTIIGLAPAEETIYPQPDFSTVPQWISSSCLAESDILWLLRTVLVGSRDYTCPFA